MSQQCDTTECSHVSIKYKAKKEKKKPLWNTWRKENAEAGAFSLVHGQNNRLQTGQKNGLWSDCRPEEKQSADSNWGSWSKSISAMYFAKSFPFSMMRTCCFKICKQQTSTYKLSSDLFHFIHQANNHMRSLSMNLCFFSLFFFKFRCKFVVVSKKKDCTIIYIWCQWPGWPSRNQSLIWDLKPLKTGCVFLCDLGELNPQSGHLFLSQLLHCSRRVHKIAERTTGPKPPRRLQKTSTNLFLQFHFDRPTLGLRD